MKYNSAKEVLEALIHGFYDERNKESCLDCITEDIEWIGTQKEEHASGKEEVRKVLEYEKKDVLFPLHVVFEPFKEQRLSDTIVMITLEGTYLDIPSIDYEFVVRGTVCCVRMEEGWLVRSIHMSTPNDGKVKYEREQRHYRTAMNMLGIVYWEWNKATGFFASESFDNYSLSQKPIEEIKNNRVLDDSIHPDDIGKLKMFFVHGDQQEKNASIIIRLKLKNGEYHWTEIFGFKEYSETGETIRLSCIMRDIDNEWREQKLQLEKALEEAKTASEAKTEFLSRISHDMRTPLNVILGMTHLAKENENPPDTQDCLNKINVSSEFLLGLINDILDMEHMESGRMELHPVPYSGEEFSQYIASVIEPLCSQKNIQFEYSYDGPDDFVVIQDKLRINQVYFNLLSNAVKYTNEGGSIQFHTHVEMFGDDKISMDVRIVDNGIGMSSEFQKHMFEPFTQEVQKKTPVSQGSGLGLSIVKQICDMMNMEISAESRLGEGTTFLLHGIYAIAKKVESRMAGKTAGLDYEEVKLQDKTILVCEDHPMNQEIIRRLLEKEGMIVVLADNGKRGVEAFEHTSPGGFAAVLMDIRMPVMDGIEAAETIRALPREDAKTIPIIALTANAYEEDIKKCRDAGMNDHIAKPVEPEHLYKTIKKNMVD